MPRAAAPTWLVGSERAIDAAVTPPSRAGTRASAMRERRASDDANAPALRDTDDAVYRVTLPSFEGPLDLLLHLVEKHELSIAELPVSFVTEKYLEYLSVMRVLQIAQQFPLGRKRGQRFSHSLLPSSQDSGVRQRKSSLPTLNVQALGLLL